MSVRLFDYNYVVQYLPGVKNTVADFLSRMPLPSKDTDEFQNTDEDGKEDMWVAIVEEDPRRKRVHSRRSVTVSPRVPRSPSNAVCSSTRVFEDYIIPYTNN
ncbi:hypothetical protein NDU88_009800 [Pleurodeles waltl]|uniref:Uncharacterized protein n=1 Tax=Pleurodeles waltl TaxID=8319 RepID=A0AAV7S1G2_PLEWA|nr:hypothetical protein NDU88_009800 [Pleurodeles waltl]